MTGAVAFEDGGSLDGRPPRVAAQRKSERTRRRIIASAQYLFDRRGYRDTTIDDITHRAQVAHGTFYLYFRGKGELLSELIEAAMEQFDRLASSQPSELADIEALIRQTLETYERNRLVMRLLREASAADEQFRVQYEEIFLGRLVLHMQPSIEHLQRRLPEASRLDSAAAARAIVGLIESFAYGIFIGGESFSTEIAVRTLTIFCARAIGLTLA